MSSRRYVICDIEATGLEENNEIIEIALITYEDGKVLDVYETLINPLKTIPENVLKLTKISPREISNAPKFYDVAESIRMRLENAVLVAHNIDFDLALLKRKFSELGHDLKVKTFCTLRVAQHDVPGLASYNLDSLCAFFGIKNQRWHRALSDAYATLELFKELFKLRLKIYPKQLFLPQHEKLIKNVPNRAGLILFKNQSGKTIRMEAVQNMQLTARTLLEVKFDNRDLVKKTFNIVAEPTGSALIAEFKKVLYFPLHINWMIVTVALNNGEKVFRVRPYKRGLKGWWFYKDYTEAKRKLKHLNTHLKQDEYVHRDSPKSKEEIVKHNQKVERLIKTASFPHQHIIILGEGKILGEKSIILIRGGHVMGHGYTQALESEIIENPEAFITHRYFMHLGVDLLAQNYLRALKNMKQKSESWQSLQSK